MQHFDNNAYLYSFGGKIKWVDASNSIGLHHKFKYNT